MKLHIDKIDELIEETKLKVAAKNKIREVYELACELYQLKTPCPTVDFEAYGRIGGRAWMGLNIISINSKMMLMNSERILEELAPHEMAHIVAYKIYGVSDHSDTWQQIAVKLGASGSRTHNYNFELARKTKKHIYYCLGCAGNCIVGSNVHNKMMEGQVRCCARCKCRNLIYRGEKA